MNERLDEYAQTVEWMHRNGVKSLSVHGLSITLEDSSEENARLKQTVQKLQMLLAKTGYRFQLPRRYAVPDLPIVDDSPYDVDPDEAEPHA